MGVVAVIGEGDRVRAYALAGAAVMVAEDDRTVIEAWAALPADTAVVVLTARAATTLRQIEPPRPGLLEVVMDDAPPGPADG